jgi:hypothetical protein
MRNVQAFGQSSAIGGVNTEDYKLDLAENELGEGTRNGVLTKLGIIKKREGSSEIGSSAGATRVRALQQYIDESDNSYIHKIVGTKLVRSNVAGASKADVKAGLTSDLATQALLFYSMDGTDVNTGTASSGTASTLVDTGIGWTVNAYIDKVVKITAGTGVGQVKLILSNTADTLTIFGRWDTNPDGTSEYDIQSTVKSAIYSNGTDQPFKVVGTTATDLGATYPKFTEANVHLKRIFYLDPSDNKKIRWTDPFISDGVLESDTQNFWDVEEDVVALGIAGRNSLIVYTANKTGALLGDEPDNFSFAWIDQRNGCIAKESVKSWDNYSLSLSEDGVYRCDGASNIRVSRKISPDLKTIPRTYRANVTGFVFDDKYHLSIPYASTSTTNDKIWVMDLIWSPTVIDEKGESDGSWIPFENLTANVFAKVIDSSNNELLYFGSTTTYKIYRLYDGTYNDIDAPINFDVYTRGITLKILIKKKRMKKLTVLAGANDGRYLLSCNYDLDQKGFSFIGNVDTNVKGALYDTATFDVSKFGGADIAMIVLRNAGSGRMVQYHFYNRELNQPMEFYGWEQVYKFKTYK